MYADGSVADGVSALGIARGLPFKCEIIVGGQPCNESFGSRRELLQHQLHSTREGHGKSQDAFRHYASTLTVTNQCPLCKKIYKDRKQAVKHVTTIAMKYAICPDKGGSWINNRVNPPDDLYCPRCDDLHFDTLEQLQNHIASFHLQPIRPSALPSGAKPKARAQQSK